MPHDQQEVHRTLEVKIQSKFDKDPGGLMLIKTEVLTHQDNPIHPAVIGYMIISGLYVWCQLIDEKKTAPS